MGKTIGGKRGGIALGMGGSYEDWFEAIVRTAWAESTRLMG
jgi:hypothetical protein